MSKKFLSVLMVVVLLLGLVALSGCNNTKTPSGGKV